MTAASFWSLLDPAFKIAKEQNYINRQLNFILIIFGFLLGAAFVYMTDLLLPSITSKQIFSFNSKKKMNELKKLTDHQENVENLEMNSIVRLRLKRNQDSEHNLQIPVRDSPREDIIHHHHERTKWHRLLLLIIAVTLHNFPG
jgi:zinc transporter ZupT